MPDPLLLRELLVGALISRAAMECDGFFLDGKHDLDATREVVGRVVTSLSPNERGSLPLDFGTKRALAWTVQRVTGHSIATDADLLLHGTPVREALEEFAQTPTRAGAVWASTVFLALSESLDEAACAP
jgi:hypothetical protein